MDDMAFGIRIEREGICLAVAPVGEDLDYDGNEDIIVDALDDLQGTAVMSLTHVSSESTAHFGGEVTTEMLEEIKECLTGRGYTEEPFNW